MHIVAIVQHSTVTNHPCGAGKTTQISQFVAYSDLPYTKGKVVGCTQPRHVTTMSIAKYVPDEMDGQLSLDLDDYVCS
ncbi:hypothetical protein OG21DRAFT_90497 [Imleria badia]|nr:hypothetical protein OG21DRAFT_90497 [Imleria badia]